MVEPKKLVQQFKNDLLGLTDNDRFKINALTIFAKDYKDNLAVAEGVATSASENVLTVPAALKLPSLYVIDSIVKIVADPYRKLFEKKIADLFVHAFEKSRDANLRVKLYKLRTTWKDIFPSNELYELDVRVRENDPAWPNLVSLEKKSKISSLPSVPKLPKEKITELETVVEPTLVLPSKESVVTIASGRDPRLKRKHSPTSSPTDGFLIDRAGDVKMESIARRQGRKEKETNENRQAQKKSTDKDTQNHRGSMWSNYFDKNAELCSKKDAKDIDLRVNGAVKPSELDSDMPMKMRKFDQSAMKTNLNTDIHMNNEPFPHHMNPPLRHPDNYYRDPPMRMGRYPIDRPMLPPIRGPDWNVEIEGFPDMIQIGIDPRMLCKTLHPKALRRITIDGCQYPLFLDRVQPLVNIADRMHAVRFRCHSVDVMIEGKRFTLPATGFKLIDFGMGKQTVYLGGPGHEIVIDGRPHTVPMNEQLSYVNLKGRMIEIQFIGNLPTTVNILPPIPPQFMKWAADMLFGAPNNLSRAPRNPLKQLQRMIENEQSERQNKNLKSDIQEKPAPETAEECNPPVVFEAPKLDVHDLFSKLVAAGIVSDSSSKLPVLKEFSWTTFKIPYQAEIDALFSGYQCVVCGLRFEDEKCSAYASHLDYHYVKNANNQTSEQRNQSWYQHVRFWLRGEMSNESAGDFSVVVQDDEQIPKCHAFADPSKNVCAVCMEKFDTYWDQTEEEWMIQGAILFEDKLYHPICQDDAGKQFSNNNSILRRHDESMDVTENSIKYEPDEESKVISNQLKDENKADPNQDKPSSPRKVVSVKQEVDDVSDQVKAEPTIVEPNVAPSCAGEYKPSLPSKSDISQDPLAALQKVLGMTTFP